MIKRRLQLKPHRRVALVYLIAAALWIMFSDVLLYYLGIDETLIPGLSIIKGIGFVLLTSTILYLYLRREFDQRATLEDDLREQISQTRQSQTAQAHSESNFRTVVEESPLPMMVFTETGAILALSRSWLEITGYRRDQFTSVAAWAELAYGTRRQPIEAHIARLFDLDRRIDEGEFVVRCADSTTRIWAFSSMPLGRLASGERAVMSVAADVTQRKQAEQEARHNHNVLQRIFDNSQFLLAYMDAEFNFIQVNERYAQDVNKSPADFIGKNHFDLYPNAEDEAIFRQVVATGEPVSMLAKPYTYPNHPERGQTYWDWSVVPVLDEAGLVIALIVTLIEVTERVLAEEQLRIKDSAIASAITPFALADLDGNLTYVNDAFLHLWQLDDARQALGRSVLEFWVSTEAAQQVVTDITEQDNYVGELTAKRADGSTAEVELMASIVRDAQGNPICMIGSFSDVTRQKQAEMITLENERLKARFQKEQERNALVQRIISALSHDLRTPLTIISTSGDMLNHYFDRLTPQQRQEKLDTIGRQVQFALELLDDTVNLARGNLSGVVFRPAPVNLAALCRVSVEELQSASYVGHRLHFANLNGMETAIVDEVLVSRILLNLLSNAIKYSPDDSEVRLELLHQGDWIVLRVIDRGIGIAETDLPYIFEPFFRAQGVGAISGTGLGLSIVKDCVERHQGSIHVESELGQGSTFTVMLPVQIALPATG